MRNFTSSALASAILLLGGSSANADILNVVSLGSNQYKVQRVDPTNNTTTDLKTFTSSYGTCAGCSFLDEYEGKLYVGGSSGYAIYDIEDNEVTLVDKPSGVVAKPFPWSGDSIISEKSNGELHIGENSWITKEEDGRQKVYAKDAAGNSIPIDYTNGTKLLINGRDVDQAIDNVGALSAALTGLPTVPQDSPLACGVGAGAHSGSNALSGGCASKINERLTFNAAASFIPANQEYQGTDNSWSGRAGFVFKLGKITKPTLISMKEKKVLQSKVEDLVKSNKNIKNENQELKELLAIQNQRLEKLEQIALGNFNSKDLVSSLQ